MQNQVKESVEPKPVVRDPLPVPEVHRKRAEALRAALLATADDKPDERLLLELVADTCAVHFAITESQALLANLLTRVLDDSKRSIIVTNTLKTSVEIGNALARRIESSLQAASALRAQRLVGAR